MAEERKNFRDPDAAIWYHLPTHTMNKTTDDDDRDDNDDNRDNEADDDNDDDRDNEDDDDNDDDRDGNGDNANRSWRKYLFMDRL